MIIANIRIAEARAWVMKYLIEASDEYISVFLERRGIIEIRLISRPIHIPIHEYDDKEIRVPEIIVEMNRSLYFLIKKKRIRTFIYGV